MWHQYYASVKHSIGSPQTIKWTGFGNVYSTHDTGDALQGKINNNAYSLSLAAQHGPHELLLGFQQVLGDQFFDYLNETNGIFLTNSMDVDYNAPHEKSLQLRYTFYGKEAGLPGFKAMVWGVTGWGRTAARVRRTTRASRASTGATARRCRAVTTSSASSRRTRSRAAS